MTDIILYGMDIEYKDVIDFSKIKKALDKRGMKVKFLAEKSGILPNRLSQICRNNVFPKSDSLAKMASVLNLPVSELVDFKIDADERKAAWFREKEVPYSPESDAKGELTYEPLRVMMSMYLDYINDIKDSDKTVNDLFDLIEPYRRRNGIANGTEEARKVSRNNAGGKSKRAYEAKGIIPEIRIKLKYDRPVNIRTIYDICNFFGCSIDWVMSYK